MGNNFVVAHCRRVKTTAGLKAVAKHNARIGVYDGAGRLLDKPEWLTNPDLGHLNTGDFLPPEAILRRREARMAEAQKATEQDGYKWRKPQKNTAAAVEIVVSASHEWYQNHSKAEARCYLEEVQEYLKNRFGSQNLLSTCQHWDEKTFHSHLLFVPIVSTDKGLKYSSSEFLGGREQMLELQTKIGEIGEKYGLSRGVLGSETRHSDKRDYHKALKELDQKGVELGVKEARLDALQARLEADKATFEKVREQANKLTNVLYCLPEKSRKDAIDVFEGMLKAYEPDLRKHQVKTKSSKSSEIEY